MITLTKQDKVLLYIAVTALNDQILEHVSNSDFQAAEKAAKDLASYLETANYFWGESK